MKFKFSLSRARGGMYKLVGKLGEEEEEILDLEWEEGGGAIIKPIFSASSPPSLQNAFLPPLPDFSPLLLPSSFGLSLSLFSPSSLQPRRELPGDEAKGRRRGYFLVQIRIRQLYLDVFPKWLQIQATLICHKRNLQHWGIPSPSGFASQRRGEEPAREIFSLSAANEFSLEGGGEREG